MHLAQDRIQALFLIGYGFYSNSSFSGTCTADASLYKQLNNSECGEVFRNERCTDHLLQRQCRELTFSETQDGRLFRSFVVSLQHDELRSVFQTALFHLGSHHMTF